ncbi:MAG: hypothetical protein JWL73_996 [Actinomycetia bacterium]|nr:hypothetical protein [Actinomycetes bacterium]
MRIRPLQLVAATCVSLVLLLTTVGVTAASAATATKPNVAATADAKSAKTVSLTIKGFAFHPSSLKAKVGQKIKVTNKDSTAHTVTADKGAFDTKDIAPGKSKTFTVKKAGKYPFHCSIHTYMKATLTVTK